MKSLKKFPHLLKKHIWILMIPRKIVN